MAQMMSKMGCHRRLCYARLLNRSGFGFVTVFVPAYVSRFPHYSVRSLKKGLSVSFHSVQPLPNSHNKSVCFLVPQHFTHLFSHLLHAVIVHSATLHFLNRISNPHLPLVSLHTIHFTSDVQPTASFSYPIHRKQKHVPNPCAYCRGRRLSSPCPFPAFPLTQTRSRLATFQSFLLSLATHTTVSQLN